MDILIGDNDNPPTLRREDLVPTEIKKVRNLLTLSRSECEGFDGEVV